MKRLITAPSLLLLNLFCFIHAVLPAQIPQNIDVNTEGETDPLSEAPTYMVILIVVLLIIFGYYIFFYRRRK